MFKSAYQITAQTKFFHKKSEGRL